MLKKSLYLSVLLCLSIAGTFAQGDNDSLVVFAGKYHNFLDPVYNRLTVRIESYPAGEQLGTFVSNDSGYFTMIVPLHDKYKFIVNVNEDADPFLAIIQPPEPTEKVQLLKQQMEFKLSNETEMIFITNLFSEKFSSDEEKFIRTEIGKKSN